MFFITRWNLKIRSSNLNWKVSLTIPRFSPLRRADWSSISRSTKPGIFFANMTSPCIPRSMSSIMVPRTCSLTGSDGTDSDMTSHLSNKSHDLQQFDEVVLSALSGKLLALLRCRSNFSFLYRFWSKKLFSVKNCKKVKFQRGESP